MRRALATLILAFPLLSQAQAEGFRSADSVIAREMAAKGIPGVVVVVVDASGVRLRRAWGVANATTGAPLTTQHLLQVGSVTKTFTALLAEQLAAHRRLDLDAPVRTYLPGLHAAIGALTTRDLIAQRSGLADLPGNDGSDNEAELARYVAAIPDSLQGLPAGAAFSYSNPGFALAGAAAQGAARRPFALLLRSEILAPLGMTSSTMRPREAMAKPYAPGHSGSPGTMGVPVTEPSNDTRLWPAGYLWSNGDDMARFLAALVSVDGAPLSPGVVRSVFERRVEVPGQPDSAAYGAGAFLDRFHNEESAWHPGSSTGYSAIWRVISGRRLGVAVLTNRDAVRLESIVEAVLADAARANGRELGPAFPRSRIVETSRRLPEDSLAALAGVYEARFPLELRWREGSLWLTRFGATLQVRPLGDDRYAVQANENAPREVFRVYPARGKWPPYIQMFLWSFVRVRP
ncbi:MAG: beta-lactamase family protein [Cytophagaceae bacterium]|nr:beta-lactamase family protein [Gemmatimonadaceae bacterium]